MTTFGVALVAVGAALFGGALAVATLYLLGRESGRSGPNSRVQMRESVSAILTKGSTKGAP